MPGLFRVRRRAPPRPSAMPMLPKSSPRATPCPTTAARRCAGRSRRRRSAACRRAGPSAACCPASTVRSPDAEHGGRHARDVGDERVHAGAGPVDEPERQPDREAGGGQQQDAPDLGGHVEAQQLQPRDRARWRGRARATAGRSRRSRSSGRARGAAPARGTRRRTTAMIPHWRLCWWRAITSATSVNAVATCTETISVGGQAERGGAARDQDEPEVPAEEPQARRHCRLTAAARSARPRRLRSLSVACARAAAHAGGASAAARRRPASRVRGRRHVKRAAVAAGRPAPMRLQRLAVARAARTAARAQASGSLRRQHAPG